MCAPQGNAEESAWQPGCKRKRKAGKDQRDHSRKEVGLGRNSVGQLPRRIGAQRIDQAHHHKHERRQGQRQPFGAGLEDRERLADRASVKTVAMPAVSQNARGRRLRSRTRMGGRTAGSECAVGASLTRR